MRKSTKGAFAAGTAAVLLLGGVGTLAYWNDSKDVGTADITSGELTLAAPVCTGGTNHDWQLDDGATFTPGTTDVVPGDTISKVCTMELHLEGEHIGATLAIDAAGLTDAGTSTLEDELTPTATFMVDGGAYTPIKVAGDYDVQATVTVTFDGPDATNGSMNGDVDLDAINVTATQTHSP